MNIYSTFSEQSKTEHESIQKTFRNLMTTFSFEKASKRSLSFFESMKHLHLKGKSYSDISYLSSRQ
eukprot:UN02630